MIIISITFDIPTAYCEYSLSLWNHEYEDSKALYQQQHALANARMKKEEFETMDDLLKQSRDFVISQRFQKVCLSVFFFIIYRDEFNQLKII